jgi:hypothetical protein
MASQIVTDKDREYAYYAGASWPIAQQMAMIDFLLKNSFLIPKETAPYVKLYRGYLDQQRKAWLSSVGSDIITKLGFILGDTRKVVRADEY